MEPIVDQRHLGARAAEKRAGRCRKCAGKMRAGAAIAQTVVGGMKDFSDDAGPVTFSAGGPGILVDCLKCEDCGWSVSINGDE